MSDTSEAAAASGMEDQAAAAHHDGRDGPKLGVMAARWFLAAAIMLVLPRQWVSAAMAFVVALVLLAVQRFASAARKRDHS